jgi:hypothetical protein
LLKLQREKQAEFTKKKQEGDRRHLALSILQERIAAE